MIHLAVFLLTLSGIVFEVGLTRIYSATIWYHFTFVAVSVALLGWGLGGFVVHRLKQSGWTPSHARAAWFSLGYAATIPACLWLVARFPFSVDRLPLYFVAPLVPFFLAGMALSMIFDLGRERAGSLYFADLGGAALGAVGIVFLLQGLGGEASLLVAAIAPAAAALLLAPGRALSAASAATAVAIGLLALAALTGTGLRVTPGTLKAMQRHMAATPGTVVTQTGWNAYSRIDAVEGFGAPYLARLYIDSDAWTNVLEWDGRLDSVTALRTWYRAHPFSFTPNPETLVIGPGGGSDVLVALAAGSRHVTAVELNPLMLQFVRHYGARAGHLYDRPEVEVVQSEGRNYISRADRRFDVIFLGFVDSWASVASGGLSLSENYLYTTEAFRDYYDHLTDDGALVILRWDVDVPRLVANSIALLGREEAAKRMLVVLERGGTPENPPQMIFMLRKRPFTPEETAAVMTSWTDARPILVPGRHVEPPYADVLSGRTSFADYAAASPRLVGPVFDDSPFYFATERPLGMPRRMAWGLALIVGPVLLLLGAVVVTGRPAGERAGPYHASIGYFAALGFGFITVELALLQHLTLLLGHPIFTLSVLLFTLLATGAAGAARSSRVRARTACLTVGGLALAYAAVLPSLVPRLLPLSLAVRVAIAIVLIAPLGFFMGMPFPRGLTRAGRGPLPAPPFYWGLNGTMSVVGSVATVVIAVTLGFRAAMIAGAAAYAVAALTAAVIDADRP
ncbi:MAG: hypothetical protein R2752_19550 [Vicinamibacterales bacterium]